MRTEKMPIFFNNSLAQFLMMNFNTSMKAKIKLKLRFEDPDYITLEFYLFLGVIGTF
jgi:hypothetical protein